MTDAGDNELYETPLCCSLVCRRKYTARARVSLDKERPGKKEINEKEREKEEGKEKKMGTNPL